MWLLGNWLANMGWSELCGYVGYLVFFLVVPSFASVSAISFPVMPEWARTLCMYFVWGPVDLLYYGCYE